ncbi:MAG TPA: phosphatidylinositol mannoside acyltransferase [Candidatus Corynebacterium gallistercoris]|uniref:Phosphatidylinositol mannoside acyltransferase n=1 Tax=Candidatus Corynebacterium gallistercoris TaxID=2838530 RepID=A0A9D1URC5_9CORY|nr:phosphatidylinositol mannoside acyltransferase [Candidatus Corynebacterium gallistercoris]
MALPVIRSIKGADDSWAEAASSLAYRAGWKITAALPQPIAARFFTAVADVASKNGAGPEQLRKNLARVVGPENVTRDLVKRSMRSYMRYWREAFQLPAMSAQQLADVLDHAFVGESREHVDAAVAAGKGVILALPHAGNWDMAGVWLVQRHGTFTTVAERLRPESLFDAFVDYRESLGFEIIALTGSEQPPMRRMEEVLRGGGLVCLMGERDMSGHGVDVQFFGEQTSMPAGPALLAQKTGASLHAVGVSFTGGDSSPEGGEEGWGFRVSPPIDAERPLEHVVQDLADHFAHNIACDPQDWHMLQPLWHADLSERRRQKMARVRANRTHEAGKGK